MSSALKQNSNEALKIGSKLNTTAGFGIMELLLVIVIIGVLSGVLYSIIEPSFQQKRARHGAMVATLDKLYLAQLACINSKSDPLNECNTIDKLDTYDVSLDGNPPPNTYYEAFSSGVNLIVRANDDSDGSGTVSPGDCVLTYTYNLDTGTVSKTESSSDDCLVEFAD